LKKVCYKVFFVVNTVSDKVVRRFSLVYLFVERLAAHIPYYVKICPKLTNPLQKRRYSINIRSWNLSCNT